MVRADIDALPIQEVNDVPYKSNLDGVKHACGHDAHTTVALATAELLWKRRATLSGTAYVIFQPAEEGPPAGEKGAGHAAGMRAGQGIGVQGGRRRLAGFHEELDVAQNILCLRMRGEVANLKGQLVRRPKIIGVLKGDEAARRCLKTSIPGMGKTGFGLRDPARGRFGADYGLGVVGGASIDNDDLLRAPGLGRDTRQGGPQVLLGIEDGHDHANVRLIRHTG